MPHARFRRSICVTFALGLAVASCAQNRSGVDEVSPEPSVIAEPDPAPTTFAPDHSTRAIALQVTIEEDYFAELGELVAASDLVVIASVGPIEEYESFPERNALTWMQEVDVREVLLGSEPDSTVTLLTSSAANPHNLQVADALRSDGEVILPALGFGGLDQGVNYVLFLTHSNVPLDTPGTPMWLAGGAQGVLRIENEKVFDAEIGPRSIQRTLAEMGIRSSESTRFEVESPRSLISSGTTLRELRSSLDMLTSEFFPRQPISVNVGAKVSLVDPGPYDPSGQTAAVRVTDLAPGTEFYLAVCQTGATSTDDCDVENAVFVVADADGTALVSIKLRSGPFAGMDSPCMDGGCSIYAGVPQLPFGSTPIAFAKSFVDRQNN